MFVVKLEMKIGTKSQDFTGIITRAVCLFFGLRRYTPLTAKSAFLL